MTMSYFSWRNFLTKGRLAGLACLCFLVACSTPKPEESFEQVSLLLKERGMVTPRWLKNSNDDAAAQAYVSQLLQEPLNSERAVQIALLNNRGLQVRYADLAVNQTDLIQAGLLSNPVFSAARSSGGSLSNIAIGIELNFMGLLMLPVTNKIEAAKQEQTKYAIGFQVLQVAHEVRATWIDAVAARQYRLFLEQQLTEPIVGSTLRDKLYHSELQAEFYQAQADEAESREKLSRLMGLDSRQLGWRLPDTLPDLPTVEPRWDNLGDQALKQRFDIIAARSEIDSISIILGVTRKNNHIRGMTMGLETTLSSGKTQLTGPSVRLEVPVFQQDETRIKRTEALLRQAEDKLLDMQVAAQSDVRAAENRMSALWKLGRTQIEETLPLANTLTSLPNIDPVGRYLDRLQFLKAQQRMVELTRNYWRAYSDLNRAVGGKLPDILIPQPQTPSSGPEVRPLQEQPPLS